MLPPGVRAFTAAEVDQMRHLIATRDSIRGHPHPNVVELERIHAATGRRRGFMVWELDPVNDVDAALAEELNGGYR